MNYVYSALLLHSAGKDINEENVKKVVSSVEQPDESKIKALVAALDGVDIADVISKAAMPTATVVASAAPAQVAEKQEGPSEEEVERKAEEAAGGLASLFG
ncbi:MAG: 50S ribosomal protein P1 [Candidatus Aenigmatarchaeota archaeon]